MNYQAIIKRLDLAINNIKQDNLITNFKNLINDLYYIYKELDKDIEKLDPVEIFLNGTEIEEKILEYFSIFTTKYIELKYNTTIEIESVDGYNVVATAAGAFDSKDGKIKYSPLGILVSKVNKSSYIQTFLHEAKHKMQHDNYQANNIEELLHNSENIIILAKEYAYDKSKSYGDFYITNYNGLFTETDADVFSINTMKIMLSELYLEYSKYIKQNHIQKDDEITTKVRILKNKITEEVSEIEQKQKSIGRLNIEIIKETYGLTTIKSQYVYDGKHLDKLIELDKYIKQHPELQETMPIFKLIFNGNIPKTYEEITADKQMLIEKYPKRKQEIEKLYKNIIKSDPILYLHYLAANNKLDLIVDFINEHQTILQEYPREIIEILDKCNSNDTCKKKK